MNDVRKSRQEVLDRWRPTILLTVMSLFAVMGLSGCGDADSASTTPAADNGQAAIPASTTVAASKGPGPTAPVAAIPAGEPASTPALTAAPDDESLPAILVESPDAGDVVKSPLRIAGTANTFEASFIVQILDADGTVLIEEPVTATSGSGMRGTFDVTIPFDATPGAEGALRAFEQSARDGSPVNVVEIPIVFAGSEEFAGP